MSDQQQQVSEADRPLSGDEILTFGPVVESQVWGASWVLREGATTKLGRVFSEQGVGKAVIIRPCMSRGRRVRGMAPVYTPAMLKENAHVFSGWSMYLNHMPSSVQEALDSAAEGDGVALMERKTGGPRPVQDIGGQVLKSWWDPNYVAEDDADYGYQKGAVLAEIWVTPFVRNLVAENAAALHTSISAWPKGGKPGNVPWAPAKRGMIIEGIREQPQGSVDFVPRGGAGGRLLLAEGQEFDPDEGPWPTAGLKEGDSQLVVSLGESVYAPRMSQVDLSKIKSRDELHAALQESAPHLLVALAPQDASGGGSGAPAGALTEAEVDAKIAEALATVPTEEQIQRRIEEGIEAGVAEDRVLAAMAAAGAEVVENANLPAGWKSKIGGSFKISSDGPSALLLSLCEEEDPVKAATEAAAALVEEADELIQEARNGGPRPRVTGQGGASRASTGADGGSTRRSASGRGPRWTEALAEAGVFDSPDDALAIHGKTTKKNEG